MVNSLALVRGFYMRRFATRMEGSLHSFSLAASRGRHFFVGQIGRLCRSACRTGFDLIGFLFYMAANRTRPASVLKDMHTGRVFYWAGRAAAFRLISAIHTNAGLGLLADVCLANMAYQIKRHLFAPDRLAFRAGRSRVW